MDIIGTKVCSGCKREKPLSMFKKQPSGKFGRYYRCKDCERLAYWKFREEVYSHYGGYVCAVCGETEPTVLQIDHVNNDGKRHRAEDGQAARKIIYWLKKHGYPPGFQVLCRWCNLVKAIMLDVESGSPLWQRRVKTLTAFAGSEDDLIAELRRIKSSSL